MKTALVDIGSNTMRLEIYGVQGSSFKKLLSKKDIAGLVSYIDNNKNLTPKGVDKLCKVITKYRDIVDFFDVDQTYYFATASLRNINNSSQVLKKVQEETGITIELLSGKEEARLGLVGISDEYSIKEGVLIDIGGGSTEITCIKKGKIHFSTSVPEGSLSLYNKFVGRLFPTKKELSGMEKYVKNLLIKEVPSVKVDCLYGSGGTMRASGNLAQELFHLKDNTRLSVEQLKELLKSLQSISDSSLKTLLQVAPGRMHTIMPGLVMAKQVGKHSGAKQICISNRGIREGFLIEHL